MARPHKDCAGNLTSLHGATTDPQKTLEPHRASMLHVMGTKEVFLVAILIIFTAPYLVWRLGRTDSFAPLVVVQIIGGIPLGLGMLGAAFPNDDSRA